MSEHVSFTARCNRVRGRIPFAYWLVYDAVVLPFLAWGAFSVSWLFVLPLLMLAGAAFFDVNEAVVKWAARGVTEA